MLGLSITLEHTLLGLRNIATPQCPCLHDWQGHSPICLNTTTGAHVSFVDGSMGYFPRLPGDKRFFSFLQCKHIYFNAVEVPGAARR